MKHCNPFDTRRFYRRALIVAGTVLLWLLTLASFQVKAKAQQEAQVERARHLAPSDVTPPLATTLTPFTFSSITLTLCSAVTSIAWGDVDHNGALDLAVGCDDAPSRVYFNAGDSTFNKAQILDGSNKTTSVAWGDMDGDRDLDLAVGNHESVVIYENVDGNGKMQRREFIDSHSDTRSVAWGDMDGDGDLDLAVGNYGSPSRIYENLGHGRFALAWQTPALNLTTAVAWGDYDNDGFLDLAIGNAGQKNEVYHNTGEKSFGLVWSSPSASNATSVAWGDYDKDGRLDLAIGNDGQKNVVYRNDDGNLVLGITLPSEPHKTTAVAWGNYNNDDYTKLAVGNIDSPNQVYQFNSQQVDMNTIWSSAETGNTRSVAWGDMDGDGDLDLAVGQNASQTGGVYLNNLYPPSTKPILFIKRPGDTPDAYFYSSAEILAGPLHPQIPITYTLVNPDNMLVGKPKYEYSLDGGSIWINTDPAELPEEPIDGAVHRANWTPLATVPIEQAIISDNARFRISITPDGAQNPIVAISPPFRVRATSCIWPENPQIQVEQNPSNRAIIRFTGQISAGSREIGFHWTFGDSPAEVSGQRIDHLYTTAGLYMIHLRVTGPDCPKNRERSTSVKLVVNTVSFVVNETLYFPLVANFKAKVVNDATNLAARALTVQDNNFNKAITTSYVPAQVDGLNGKSTTNTTLTWQPHQDDDQLQGYRVYRYPLGNFDAAAVIAQLASDVTQYVDQSSSCGYAYYITAFNTESESQPSTSTYYGLPCLP